MKVDNALSKEFLLRYPVEAARALEQVSVDDVAALFTELPHETVAPVLTAMLPDAASTCVAKLAPSHGALLLSHLPVNRAARVYRLLPPRQQEELLSHFSTQTRYRLRRYLQRASLSANNIMDTTMVMLPEDLTVADAIRRIERRGQNVGCEIYVVNNTQQLQGVIELDRLLTSNNHARLKDIMDRSVRSISANVTTERLLSHPGWSSRQRLPVVERDNTLVGVLYHNRLRETGGDESVGLQDPVDNLLSIAGLYWLSLAQLIESLWNPPAPVNKNLKGEKP